MKPTPKGAMLTRLTMTTVLLLFAAQAHGQVVGVKTNLLHWATTTPNIAVELGLGKRTSVELYGSYNPWTFNREENKKLQAWIIQPEIRLWNGERFNRGFWGFHATLGSYNAGGVKLPLGIFPDLEKYRYEGWMAGVGVSYGYQWYLGPHWNLEATFGFGYTYMKHDRYECLRCSEYEPGEVKHYFGPTKIGVSFVYLFKSKK